MMIERYSIQLYLLRTLIKLCNDAIDEDATNLPFSLILKEKEIFAFIFVKKKKGKMFFKEKINGRIVRQRQKNSIWLCRILKCQYHMKISFANPSEKRSKARTSTITVKR